METVSIDFSYKTLIAKFFFENKLIAQRNERVDKGFKYVLANVPNSDLSVKLQNVIKTKVGSVETTFFKKWKESKFKSKDEFEQKFAKWIHTNLKVSDYVFCMK